MIPEDRTTGASVVVGCIGAIIGGLWVFVWITRLRGFEWTPMLCATLTAGVTTGFVACFFISKWYLRFMEHRSWQRGIIFGPLFAILAGVISGAMTGFVLKFYTNMNLLGPLTTVLGGLAFGSLSGLVVGLPSSLIFGAIRTTSARVRIYLIAITAILIILIPVYI
jgi:hypothetical protein